MAQGELDMTLLEKRQAELDTLIEELIEFTESLRVCYEYKLSDTNDRVRDVAEKALLARILAAKIDDLRDVEKYGSDGGR